jgi:hypothetical protein
MGRRAVITLLVEEKYSKFYLEMELQLIMPKDGLKIVGIFIFEML